MSLTEKTHAGGFIMSEAEGKRSRDNVTIASGQNLYAGAVLGKITSGGKYTAINQGASDGSQTAVAILIGRCDASAADTAAAVINCDAEVNGDELDWGSESPTEVTTGVAELLAVGIKVR